MKSIIDFKKMKKNGEKISMITSYDYWSASIINETNIDCILVGDSLAMTMHGYDSTLPATAELMALHTQAVRKGAPDKFIIGDMPFLTYRKDLNACLDTVQSLMIAGANCVKLEGVEGHNQHIKHIVQSGVPVMGHLGLTPQSVHQLGGYKVQGKNKGAYQKIIDEAKALEDLGAFSLVLECVPTDLALEITNSISIPTIGIGASMHTDGQVLVFQDLLGLNKNFKPKFLKEYLNGHELISNAINLYDQEVKAIEFPTIKESF